MKGYITLDYELGMGKITGTPEKCLIEPMYHLTELTDKFGIKLNVFVDAAYLLRLRALKDEFSQLQKDYEIVISNVTKLDSEGHSIQLHLHPQWLYSNFDGEKWNLDFEHYKLSDMPLEEQKNIITKGTQLLNSLITRKVSTFRAGGYSIENYSELREVFALNGIKMDSSVLRGEYTNSKFQTYDYRTIPNKTSYYFFNNPKVEAKGDSIEFPISTVVVPSLVYLINKKTKHKEYSDIIETKRKWGDGIGIGYAGNKVQVLLNKIKMLLGYKTIRASIDIGVDLERVYAYSKKHYEGDDFVIIGHPKSISPFTVKVLERFIVNHPEIEFKTFS